MAVITVEEEAEAKADSILLFDNEVNAESDEERSDRGATSRLHIGVSSSILNTKN